MDVHTCMYLHSFIVLRSFLSRHLPSQGWAGRSIGNPQKPRSCSHEDSQRYPHARLWTPVWPLRAPVRKIRGERQVVNRNIEGQEAMENNDRL